MVCFKFQRFSLIFGFLWFVALRREEQREHERRAPAVAARGEPAPAREAPPRQGVGAPGDEGRGCIEAHDIAPGTFAPLQDFSRNPGIVGRRSSSGKNVEWFN